jgi:hypothetical protein
MDKIVEALCASFKQERGLAALDDADLFEAFAGFCVLSSYFEDEFDADEFRIGAGGDLGIDVAGIIINGDLLLDAADVQAAVNAARALDVKIILTQAKRSESFQTGVFSELADNLFELFTADVLAYPANADVVNLKKCITALYADLSKYSRGLPSLVVRYVATGATGDPLLKSKAAAAAARLDQTNFFSTVDVAAVGAREIRDLYQKATTAVSADFAMAKRITLPKIPGVEQAFVGVLAASELVRIMTDSGGGIRKTLFFENVRDFQDYNPVNREIQGTLRDPDRCDRFAVLNNGVTIVTREMTLAGDDIHVKDFQIVNGCQTCHVLFDEKDSLGEGVYVNLRLIQSNDEDVITGITAATNRQTAVSDEDLAAQEKFHKDLEALFISFPEPERLYYERRSRQYSSMQTVEKTRIITRGHLTRTFASMFLDEPSRAGRYYKELKDTRAADLFQPSHSPLAYYTSAAAAYRLDWLFRNKRVDRKFATAKYQLLMAIKTRLLGAGSLPAGDRKANKECQKILDVIWDQAKSEKLITELLVPLQAAINAESESGTLNRDTVRTQRFADRLRKEVLAMSGTPS